MAPARHLNQATVPSGCGSARDGGGGESSPPGLRVFSRLTSPGKSTRLLLPPTPLSSSSIRVPHSAAETLLASSQDLHAVLADSLRMVDGQMRQDAGDGRLAGCPVVHAIRGRTRHARRRRRRQLPDCVASSAPVLQSQGG